ncbi:MAG TPA: carbamoylphosphate synthase large subunit [Candidatus Limnocylindria bacterium]|nr:carbamoylphosphate synthase large subunit [Candidatus Limnocylindria bacterium]
MNFVFVSPHFPSHYWRFCAALKREGVNVLGIADQPEDQLSPELRASLTDYYQVGSLGDGEEMLRAIGWFTHRYGKVDWIESNNEHWLEQDAWLRTMFHVTTGPGMEDIAPYKRKSLMKGEYAKAGIPTAEWAMADTLENALAFAAKAGYPIIAKPDVGVGANDTFRLDDEAALRTFFARLPLRPYLLERFVDGEICSYDAIIGSRGQPLYETGNVTLVSVMDVVNEKTESAYMIVPEIAEDVRDMGRRTAAAFGVKSRLVHLEFFRLRSGHPGLGKKGDVVGLEVNMRPSGGFTPDMINYAGSVDVHRLWAEMVTKDRVEPDEGRKRYFCVFVGRRDVRAYAHTHLDLMAQWGHRVVLHDRMPEALSGAMGNDVYLAQCVSREEADAFVAYAVRRAA